MQAESIVKHDPPILSWQGEEKGGNKGVNIKGRIEKKADREKSVTVDTSRKNVIDLPI